MNVVAAPPPMPACTAPESRAGNTLFREFTGPLTQELVQTPGDFGLGKVPARLKPDATTGMVCGFCSTGCGLNIHLRDGQAVNLTPATGYPVNLGMACPKGWEALTPLTAANRATTPLLRDAAGKLQPVDWDHAMREFCSRMKAIQARHGTGAVAWLGTGQITTEELAFLGALGKFGMGILHGDGNTRQCMATAVVAYKQSFGFDAPPYTYQDFEESDVIVLVGSNLCIAHPILWQRVLRNRNRPEIIVVDPRKTETAMAATQHLALAPKSDLVLFYGVANLLIQNDWIDHAYIEAHTNGFAGFAGHVRQFTPDAVAAQTGLTVGQIYRFAESIHRGTAVSFWWTMGVNQGHESTRTAQAIIDLALMTGNLGRPGTGANSITGQCNAMGSRLFSNTTNLLGGHDFTKPADREKIARILGIPVERIPQENSLAYDQIMDGIERGEIKALWLIATNTAHSWIHQARAIKTLRKLELLVVQEMFHDTESAALAHLVLPAAAWGEKDGTFINSERRIGLLKKVSVAPGQALSDFNIFRLIARYWGCDDLFKDWTSPEAVFQILKKCSAGQPCDITDIENYEMLDAWGGFNGRSPARGTPAKTLPPTADPRRRSFSDDSSQTAAFIILMAARVFCTNRRRPRRRQPTRNTPCCSSPAAELPRSGTRRHAPVARRSCGVFTRQASMSSCTRTTRHGLESRRTIPCGSRHVAGVWSRPPTSRRPSGPDRSSCPCTTRRRTCSPSRASTAIRDNRITSIAR